jgi:ribosomal protein L25 (general stress protein Ctc)
LFLAAVLSDAPAAPITKDKPEQAPLANEMVRKALDQTINNLEIDNQPFHLAIDQLREETKINFVLDRTSIAVAGIEIETTPVKVKLQKVKLRRGLQTILNQYGLSYVIIGESVLVTTEEMAIYRQLRQRVNIDLERVQLSTALKQLARETGTNLLIDSRAQKEAQTPVSLQLDDVPLETAVRLLAESADLKPVRMGNVVLVTTKAHATDLRAEPDLVISPRNPNVEIPTPPGAVVIPAPGAQPVPPVPPPAPMPQGPAGPLTPPGPGVLPSRPPQ